MKIQCGCGQRKIFGFLNIDIDPAVNPDIVDDIRTLSKIDNNSVDYIFSSHNLEHCGRHEYKQVLTRWFEVLRPGGLLRVAVPDLEAVFRYYLETGDSLSMLLGFLYGGQRNNYDYHKCGFDFNLLSNKLIEVGFINVKRYNWKDTEHFFIDDYSQSYLPHMNKGDGTLMSLNVEAYKPQ